MGEAKVRKPGTKRATIRLRGPKRTSICSVFIMQAEEPKLKRQ